MNKVTGAFESWGIALRWPETGWRDLTRRQQIGIALRAIAQPACSPWPHGISTGARLSRCGAPSGSGYRSLR